MSLTLTQDQEMLRQSARGFLQDKAPVSALRKLRDSKDETGFSRALWKEMAEMGWAGILVSEEYDGVNFGFVGAGLIAEEMGRTLTASPFISTAIVGASALEKFGNNEQKSEILPKIASGDLLMALGVDGRAKHAPLYTGVEAKKSGNGYKLRGAKVFIADGHVADKVIISARTSGNEGDKEGVTLFLVDADAKNLRRNRVNMVDARPTAKMHFDDVEVTGDDILGDVDQGARALEQILDCGRAGLAAEMSGASQQAFAMTIDYMKERQQFGQTIGAFQALQHRSAHLYCEIELMKSAILKALHDLDHNFAMAGAICAVAKAKAGEVAKLSTLEAIQLHGGIGMTDEYDVGFYCKRVRVTQEMFGDFTFHADRLASMRGY